MTVPIIALQLATIVLHAGGYRTERMGHHRITFQVLPEIMDKETESQSAYFDLCRSKRNITDYDRAGQISEKEAEEILKQAREFQRDVQRWLKKHHSSLVQEDEGR